MRIIDIILKDLKIMLTDKKALGLIILMPIILTTILGSALGGSFIDQGNNSKINIAIVKKYDQENETQKFLDSLKGDNIAGNISEEQIGELSKSIKDLNIDSIFTEDFLKNEEMKKIVEFQIVEEDKAMELLSEDKISAVVVLPENFIYDMFINYLTPFRNKVEVKVVGHPEKYIASQIVEGIMKGFTDTISTMIIGKNVFLELAMEENMGTEAYKNMGNIIEGMSENIKSIGIDLEYIKVNGKKPISSFQYYATAMTAMFILFTAANGGKLLLDEKNDMTYQRMVIAGTSKFKVVTGKFFTIFAIGLIQIGAMVLFTSLALKVDWGNILLVSLITLCAVFTVAGLGTMISAFTLKSGNYKVADLFQAAVVHAMSLLGGSFMPLDFLPKAMQNLSNFTLNGLALKAYQKVMIGYGIEEIGAFLLGLILMGIVFTIIAVYVLNKGEGWENDKRIKTKTIEIEG